MNEYGGKNVKPDKEVMGFVPILLVYALITLGFTYMLFGNLDKEIELRYSQFVSELNAGTVNELIVDEKKISGEFISGKNKGHHFSTVKVDPKLPYP
jgi:hypothetical protein